MIIENVDALKSWLAKLLEPICDADPSALANYVVALVKKDKPEKELKALCADQLDVFLQKETVGFVDKLFECLTTKIYLGNTAPKEAPKEEVQAPAVKTEGEEGAVTEGPEEERENRRRRSPLRNRPEFNDSRSRDDRRRDERKRRDFERQGKGGDSHRDRERHERRRGSPRGRSYSRSRSGSRGKSRDREHRGGRDFKSKFEVERKDQDGYNSSATSGSQQQQHASPLLPLPTPPHPFPPSSSAGATGAGGVSVATSAHLPDSTTDSWSGYYAAQRKDGVSKAFGNKGASLKQRCRDYDEKGFCVRGDLCLFDHGNDPLIVDDVNLPNMIPFPPPPVMPPPGLPMPPIPEPPPSLRMPSMPPYGHPPPGVFPMARPPLIPTSGIDSPNHQSAVTPSPLIRPPLVGLRPTLPPHPPPQPPPSSSTVSLRPQYIQSEYNYDPEGYNPESPGLTAPGPNSYRQFIPRVQSQRSNLIGLTSSEGQVSRAANIVIQTEPATGVGAPGANASRFNTEQDSRKRSMGAITAEGPVMKKPWMEKSNFNNRHKGIFPKRNYYMNTKLEVRRIPPELNNITKLNEHFSKFGTIVNIQVVYGGDPRAALIQYTKNEEARRAISSIEAVLDNRFICVYWHREPDTNSAGLQQQEQSLGNQGPGATPGQGLQHINMHKGIKQHNAATYVLNNIPPKHQQNATAGPTNPSKTDNLTPTSDTATVAPGHTNTQKGPYTSTALKPSSKSLGQTGKALEAQEALKKKQEALKLQQDMRKKKQEMLKTQIECQKALINRLEKNRSMKPEERANIMKTLKELTEKISQLQNEMNAASQVSGVKTSPNQPKTKTDQTHKELLDAELEIHKKMSSGEDTTDLKRKLGQLQVEATRLGLIRPPAGRGRGRGKMLQGPGAIHGGRGRRDMAARGGLVNRMVIDHRPRALVILGVTQEEKEELRLHFVKFGEVEELGDQDANSLILTFRTRSEAENAANQGAKFKGRMLQISWYKPKTPSVTTEPEEEEAKDEDSTKDASSYLPGEDRDEEEEEEDDDEDDENESRSWRR
ncbi:RNA-binding protein 27 isoform X1 [Oryzias latipes]|uniref:RNA binding motif protein 27 n=1 Tax=Oryzias latipes TaxID=8090 RepID=A0A3B3IMW4_ORYLA|nr:RNA-binding protein 27 isoform X1 [Oryzias latipes]